ncbi:Afadin and alpha-actinin-binding-domain-containing protein [Panaeolus papilionaceus]|nr:Afadin and alpha-actinin-binding-domain-containing protein [Panaeolus papilionaceus]
MSTTPTKKVHWQNKDSPYSDFGSPFFEQESEASVISPTSVEYINNQLLAHGFVSPPGISLDGISPDASTRVIKCMLALLSQRMNDMSRTEDISTKFKTLSYDHERILSMYRRSVESTANAEREMNLHKSRLAAALKALQASENAHKHTSAELTRTRTAMQGVRATHQSELKKKEKEIERTLERWQKISDSQYKIAGTHSGLQCANVAAIEGQDIGRGHGFLDVALEQSEQARAQLEDEILYLKKLVVRTTNTIQTMLYQARCTILNNPNLDEPIEFNVTNLFPLAPPNAAGEQLDVVLNGLNDTLATLAGKNYADGPAVQPTIQVVQGDNEENEALQDMVAKLQQDLAESEAKATSQAEEIRNMFDKFTESQQVIASLATQASSAATSTLVVEQREKLEALKNELEGERQKLTQAAAQFSKDRAALEEERIQFMDEKRNWQMQKVLPKSHKPESQLSPRKPKSKPLPASPRKVSAPSQRGVKASPAKVRVGKAGASRKAHKTSKSISSPSKVTSYQTELVAPLAAPSFLPTAFVLPPPSPRASLPRSTIPPSSTSPPESPSSNGKETSSSESSDLLSVPSNLIPPPTTPRPFPVAKPFAMRMIHAYSPMKPSPLKEALTLSMSSSTSSPPVQAFKTEKLLLESLSDSRVDVVIREPSPEMSLAAQLGVESPPDSPLQRSNVVQPTAKARRTTKDETAIKKSLALTKDKGKARAEPTSRTASGEKENGVTKTRIASTKTMSKLPPMPSMTTKKVSPTSSTETMKVAAKPSSRSTTNGATTRTKEPSKPFPPMAGGGPKRVVNGTEVPSSKSWK